jgi:hypothetical protein
VTEDAKKGVRNELATIINKVAFDAFWGGMKSRMLTNKNYIVVNFPDVYPTPQTLRSIAINK